MPETTTVEPADRLRAAAALVRKRSAAATYGLCPGYVQGAVRHVARNCDIHCGHDEHYDAPDDPNWDRYDDVPWMTLMRPEIGEPLAAWLESVAIRLDQSTHAEWQAAVEPRALALADALLAAATP